MGFTLEVENYRALRKVRWSPSGVCAITGPNGSGKTTLLSVLEFLRHFLQRGAKAAIEYSGGTAGLLNQFAGRDDAIRIQLTHSEGTWSVLPTLAPPSLAIGEVISFKDETVASWVPGMKAAVIRGKEYRYLDVSLLERSRELLEEPLEVVNALHRLVTGYRLYEQPRVLDLRRAGSKVSSDTELSSLGENAFSVLRNWKAGLREHEERWTFVRSGLQECFPELFDDLEFEVAGQTVTVRLYFRGLREPVDVFSAPHGLLVAMIHLCAVASTPDHGALAIDEPENGLHPFAIRTLLELMRSRAKARDLTILLATHSPVVLNTFNTEPNRVYVMEPGHEVLPVPMNEHSDPQWLAHFALGDLYSDQAFGAQLRPPP
jgi:predicted ATPase